mmetsp:Transcript_70134/g.137731  ORF Transcript_70134/g.137731 Transcript_70134/m.137731 type:complete len:292 (-) Transcript_70134:495-1370(-)
MHLEDGDACLREEFGIELRQPSGGEEYHDLVFFRHPPNFRVHSRPQKLRHPLHVGDANALVDLLGCDFLVGLDGVNPLMLRLQRQLRDLANRRRKRGGKQRALPVLWRGHGPQDFQNRVAEAHVEQLICLVKGQEVQLADAIPKAGGVVEVILETTRRRNKNVHRLRLQRGMIALDVRAAVEASNTQALVEFQQHLCLLRDLLRELAGGREDHGGDRASDACRIACELLDDRHEERQCLACAGLRPRDDVLASEHRSDRRGLDLCHQLVTETLRQRPLRLARNLQRRELLR